GPGPGAAPAPGGDPDELAVALVLIAATTVLSDLRFAVRPISQLRRLVTLRPLADPKLRAMAGIVVSIGDEEVFRRRIAEAIGSDDPATAMLGALIGSVSAENDGRRDEAVVFARSAVRLAEALHDTWGQAMAGQMLGALHSQSAEPVESLRWSRRARIGLAALGAVEDIRQLDWTIATNAIAVGDLAEAAELFGHLVDSPGEADGVDIRSIGLAGMAEVQRARGDTAAARALNLEALSSFETPGTRASPWFRMVLSAVLAASTLDATGTAEENRRLARRLRSRVLATLRPGTRAFVDAPVLGASVVGLAVWAEALPAATPLTASEALELLALAEVLGARQDSPALHLAPLLARAETRLGAGAVDAARVAAAALPAEARPSRIEHLLRRPGPWSWAWQPAGDDPDATCTSKK
ncbi:MAG: hypothetical protein Q7T71_01970, partial [Herbiconiux sp.]|nr:hypothetical protein [Herbiconiux sp.]